MADSGDATDPDPADDSELAAARAELEQLSAPELGALCQRWRAALRSYEADSDEDRQMVTILVGVLVELERAAYAKRYGADVSGRDHGPGPPRRPRGH